MAQFHLGVMAWLEGRPDEGAERTREAVKVARSVGESFSIASSLTFEGLVHCFRRDSQALDLSTVALEYALEQRLPAWIGYSSLCIVHGSRIGPCRTACRRPIERMRRDGELWYLPEAFRFRGKARLAEGEIAGAEVDFREAVDVARSQAAKSFKLRAATDLARLWHSQAKTDVTRSTYAGE